MDKVRPGHVLDEEKTMRQASYDQCRTWPVAKVLDPGYSGHSDLAVTGDHTILCLYETEGCRAITLARFNLEWLTDGSDSVTGKSK
jgi:sialidase-1